MFLCLFWRFKARESDIFKITIGLSLYDEMEVQFNASLTCEQEECVNRACFPPYSRAANDNTVTKHFSYTMVQTSFPFKVK